MAQTDVDAIRYSQMVPSATARSLGMGGAFGALGADFSVLSNNPAGIAFYRKSEFTITPAFGNTSTESSYLGRKTSDNKFNFNLGNIGLIYAYPKEDSKSDWRGWAFGIGYNKLNSFHSASIYEGVNSNNSLLDSYVQDANGNIPDELASTYAFGADLAWQTYLIDTLPGSLTNYFSAIPEGGALQRRIKETRGSSGEAVLSFGGNYKDKVFWGLTLGFPYVRYHEDIVYEEIDQADDITQTTPGIDSSYAAFYNFESFTLTQNVATSGNGFHAKFGLIIRPNEWLRFGTAIHSPAYYSMHDEYITYMHANFSGESYDYETPFGIFDYHLTTPFRASGSLALIYQQKGVFSIDYEFADYSSAKLSPGYDFLDVNQIIRNVYTQGHNIRAGAEWKYGVFAFRLGAGYQTGIIKSNLSSSDTDQHKFTYSGGFGIREESYFIDLGYSLTSGNEFYRQYSLTDESVEGAFSKIRDHRLLLTLGFRF